MPRTADERRRAELLERIVDYVMKSGLADLSLRPLAKAVGSSPRVLLYYFGSKEDLVTEVLVRAGERQRDMFAKLPKNPQSYEQTMRAAWRIVSAPEREAIFRLFFETYGLALQNRKRFARFLDRVVENWLAYLEAPAIRDGYSRKEARAMATVMIAGFRGFMLDLCATRDRKRIDRAVEIWIKALDALPPPRAKLSSRA
ncbi:MAG: TetR/AcrR family transcriptional regulator [Vulcanimicrobiaceae bacterium]